MRAVFILTAVMGAALVLYALTQLGQELRSYGWRAVPVVIVQSSIVETMTTASVDIDTAQPNETIWYRPEVVYSYRMDGFDYQSDVISAASPRLGRQMDMQPIVARYPIGAAVTAYVSPDDPAVAVLERGVTALSVIMLLAGSLGLATSLWFWRGLKPHVRPSQRRKRG